MSDWLDLELSHNLAPTEAPPELWGRITAARARRSSPHFALPIAAVVTLVLAGALFFIARGAPAPQPYRGYTATAHTECASCHATI